MKYLNKYILILSASITGFSIHAQVVYESTSNHGIYEFLDEMANMKIIELNDIVKPFSRKVIYEKLNEVDKFSREYGVRSEAESGGLNKRQRQELEFYLQAYVLEGKVPVSWREHTDLLRKSTNFATALNPLGSFYKDSIFTAAVQVIYGASYTANQNGNLTHTYGGASLFGYIGKNVGFYANVRDNNLSKIMMDPEYLVHTQGASYKNYGDKGIDFSEVNGGLTFSWKWGNIGLIKDNLEWGTAYNGTNIQSGHAPSFAMIKLQLNPARWFDFNYYHGWLVSQVVDSARSYWTNGTYRSVFYPKYIAANMFTFYPIKNFNVSFGNSIVYSDLGGPHLAYLIPFLFYKSVDHTLNATYDEGQAGQNAQMYLSLSSRNIKHLHLYFTIFADDLSVRYFSNKNEFNYFSYKTGFRLSNFLLQNISLTAEYTHTNPFVYEHIINTQTYTSNKYNMGHYLRDNSRELYFNMQYKPIRGLDLSLSYIFAQRGDDYDKIECYFDPNCNHHKVPILKNITWEKHTILINIMYEVVSNTYFYLKYQYSEIISDDIKYTPALYRGITDTYSFGFNIGF